MYCNSSNTTIDESVQFTRLICTQILLPTVCAIGIICNLLNVIVLTRKQMISSTNNYLLAIAIADISYLVSLFMVSLQLYNFVQYSPFLFKLIIYVMSPISAFTSSVTAWLCVCFTMERLLVVLKPLKIREYCSLKRSRLIICVCNLLVFIITVPDFFIRHLNCTSTNNDITICCVHMSQYYLTFRRYQYFNLNAITFIFVPLIMLTTANCLLIYYLVKSRRQRYTMTQSRQSTKHLTNLISKISRFTVIDDGNNTETGIDSENSNVLINRNGVIAKKKRVSNLLGANTEQFRVTYLLVIVIISFCVLQTPIAINFLLTQLSKSRHPSLLIFGNIGNLFMAINAAMNFILYSFFSQKFRNAFKMTFYKKSSVR